MVTFCADGSRVVPFHKFSCRCKDTCTAAGSSVRVRTGIHTFSPAVGRLEPIRDRLRSFQSEPHPAPLRAKSETQKFTKLPPMINLIATLSLFARSGFLSSSIVPFQRAYARPKASCFGREFAFFRRHFLQGSRCAGQYGIIEKIHRESKHPSQLSKKKLDEKSDKCRPHNQLILPG